MRSRAAMADVISIRAIGDHVQQRKAIRFHIRLPVIFRWSDEQSSRQQNGGFTRDISTGGLFIYSLIPPPLGVTVELEVVLPALEESGHGVRLRSEGRVLRIERKGDPTGFAAT